MKKHKHYQALRAYADGWKIKRYDRDNKQWHPTSHPGFFTKSKYRIVPDEDGWIPWYMHKDAERPIDGPVDLMYGDGDVETIEDLRWWTDKNVTHYRPHTEKSKREKILKVLEYYIGWNASDMIDKIMEIVEE